MRVLSRRRSVILTVLWLGVALFAIWPASRLASYLAARSLARLAPEPFATIDRPAANARVGHELVVAGRVVHETIRAPLWLLVSRAGAAWEPEGAIETASGAWERAMWLGGRKGTNYRLVVVAAPHPLPASFAQAQEELEKERWRHQLLLQQNEEAGGRRPWEAAPLGDGTYPPLPANARLVAALDVVLAEPASLLPPDGQGKSRARR
jgi:hypothetical protein